ncbi:hypothetical protein TD95_000766 [Thielaviopsis punctulata]|uniref:DUF4045 domain-containing protein n=1 Tax=Thielaviopsis punctulata TaxID=72032 RepID=A0A0F4Z8J9_9PEZI|nr:hypothetical protein TD95_000766 [Thielaviopsis punctulata]
MSDDVSQFLQQVEELKGRRIEEDEARSRELEERILQERSERAARRAVEAELDCSSSSSQAVKSTHLYYIQDSIFTMSTSDEKRRSLRQSRLTASFHYSERARSISPQKSSPAHTPPVNYRSSFILTDNLRLESPVRRNTTTESPNFRADSASFSTTAAKENSLSLDTKRTDLGSAPTRESANPSWHRRALSQSPDKYERRSRPLSMLASENAFARINPDGSQARDQTLTKDQIAQALGSKDASWFRQTSDRGANSPAYRRTQVEDDDRLDMNAASKGLPGMASEQSPTKRLMTRSGNASLDLGSPPKLDPPSFSSPSPGPDGDKSPTRSMSPTKGLGGFVQSAMMKRSDSAKRWSVTSPAGLARADSIVASKTGGSRPTSIIRDGSAAPLFKSRPSSRQGLDEKDEIQEEPTSSIRPPADPIFDPKYVMKHSTLAPDKDVEDDEKDKEGEKDRSTPPSSPSKALDTRRWSPTKASWLETALNKPESPKKTHAPTTSQPAWMVELNKAKAHKTGGPKTESESALKSPVVKHEVKIGGLMRNIPMGSTTSPTPISGVYPPPSITSPFGPTIQRKNTLSSAASPPPLDDVKPPVAAKPVLNRPSAASISAKPKPEVPGKIDFRANLKTRKSSPSVSEPNGANELKNVVGSLRRTTTQNYVAPDELKSTILKGKSELNATGGPKRSEIRDEFKDDILKKRDSFKKAQMEGRGIRPSSNSVSSNDIPEGLQRFRQMGRSGSIVSSSPFTASGKSILSPPAPAKPASISMRQNMESVEKATEKLSQQFKEETRVKEEPVVTSKPEPPVPVKTIGRAAGGGLASRFNPGLAGLLARGPPPLASGGGSKPSAVSGEGESGPSAPLSGTTETPSAPGPQLTHLTKGRARGPRRKAPTATKSAPSAAPIVEEVEEKIFKKVAEELKVPEPKSVVSPAPIPSPKVDPEDKKADMIEPTQIKPQTFTRVSPPLSPSSSPMAAESTKQSPSQVDSAGVIGGGRKPWQPVAVTSGVVEKAASFSSGRPLPGPKPELKSSPMSEKPVVREKPSPSQFVPSRIIKERADAPVRSPFARNLPAIPVAEPEVKKVESVSAPEPLPAPVASTPTTEHQMDFSSRNNITNTPAKTVSSHATGNSSSGTPRSLTKPSLEAAAALTEFFGDKKPLREYKVDTASILIQRPQGSQVTKTLALKLFQLSGDGRQVPVPAHNERILFDHEMYICIHSFTSITGSNVAQVYFWAGDEVPPSALEDAQVFANREARNAGADLIRMAQGRETAEFIHALGGVVIIRRGSSNKYDSLATSMLCGRRHLGQVVFDEVDFSVANLCSGFPYLIAKSGRCVLWKGKGSDVQELSCARLVGMDLTLTGDLEEVDDGHEPESFWAMFNGSTKPHSADHWRLKPNYDMYSSRLFQSDANTKEQIVELSPFNQSNMNPTGIYVIDAFFEMYIIVGAKAQMQYASFRNALDFAQEYAILASSMEDRPFVPISTVVLEGIPRDLKSVFRKWTDAHSPTIMTEAAASTTATAASGAPGLKRGRSLRIVPLTHALQAFSE